MCQVATTHIAFVSLTYIVLFDTDAATMWTIRLLSGPDHFDRNPSVGF